MAGGKGFEPLQTDPESAVLPLDEPPLQKQFYHRFFYSSRIVKQILSPTLRPIFEALYASVGSMILFQEFPCFQTMED